MVRAPEEEVMVGGEVVLTVIGALRALCMAELDRAPTMGDLVALATIDIMVHMVLDMEVQSTTDSEGQEHEG